MEFLFSSGFGDIGSPSLIRNVKGRVLLVWERLHKVPLSMISLAQIGSRHEQQNTLSIFAPPRSNECWCRGNVEESGSFPLLLHSLSGGFPCFAMSINAALAFLHNHLHLLPILSYFSFYYNKRV